MSVQFGKCNFDGRPVCRADMSAARSALVPYGSDSDAIIIKDNVGVLHCAFHTTEDSRSMQQPYVSGAGMLITWDGRLDNREELILQLEDLRHPCSDVEIVAAAFERWGTESFAKLIGDWAVSIWNGNKSLILAKDPIGARPLYYSFENFQLTWSSILDPILSFRGGSITLEEEYLAGWLSSFPATHLTPYIGIHSVPPASYVRFENGGQVTRTYWVFDSRKKILYQRDDDYEQHFRAVFAESIRRRLRSDGPVLAELSGGMDSSSIVCMADTIIEGGGTGLPQLDTVSYYNDSEPNWNERPYFSMVEQQRRRKGCHINVGSQMFRFISGDNEFSALPGSGTYAVEAANTFAAHITAQGYRVVLSGAWRRRVMGAVPTPSPELADLLAKGQFLALAHQLKLWALNKRKPWLYLLADVARGFLPPAWIGVPKHMRPPSWLQESFTKRHRFASTGYPRRLRLFGALPSLQENLTTLETLQRQISCSSLHSRPHYDKRYPYLDRSLLEFLYAVPREQLLRPGQRRSLMRRALVGIVPSEILDRRRKAYVIREPMVAIQEAWGDLTKETEHLLSVALGIVGTGAHC